MEASRQKKWRNLMSLPVLLMSWDLAHPLESHSFLGDGTGGADDSVSHQGLTFCDQTKVVAVKKTK